MARTKGIRRKYVVIALVNGKITISQSELEAVIELF